MCGSLYLPRFMFRGVIDSDVHDLLYSPCDALGLPIHYEEVIQLDWTIWEQNSNIPWTVMHMMGLGLSRKPSPHALCSSSQVSYQSLADIHINHYVPGSIKNSLCPWAPTQVDRKLGSTVASEWWCQTSPIYKTEDYLLNAFLSTIDTNPSKKKIQELYARISKQDYLQLPLHSST